MKLGMNLSTRLITVLFIVMYFVVLLIMLKRKKLALKYSLLWIFSGLAFLIIAIFPNLLVLATTLAGIEVPSNGLFAMLIVLFILILMSLTVIASETGAKIKTLVQKMALMEKRIRELEKVNQEK